MALGYAVVALLAASVAVFSLQNSDPTRIRFALWVIEGVPLAAVVLVSLAAGLLVAGIPLWLSRWRARARVRALEARMQALERAAATTPAAGVAPSAARPRIVGQ